MKRKMSADDLRAFETKVAESFNAGEILAPIHLYSGNEENMLDVFEDIEEKDWVLCSWRSHYQCLLKGVPTEEVLSQIKAGRSISLCFAEYKIFSSAIVGGVLPIATGLALALKRQQSANRVHVFLGDMTAETGIAHECMKYSENHALPIRFIVEDDGKSVCTNTAHVWGLSESTLANTAYRNVSYYKYKNKYPHAGAGVRVQF